MKSLFLSLAVFCMLCLSSCDYFKNHRLFSKDDDAVDMRTDKQEDLEDSTSVAQFDDTDTLPADLTADEYAEVQSGETQADAYTPPDFSPSGDARYFMIAGSFQNQNLANRYAEQIIEKGYNSNVLECPDGYYRVSAKSYSDFKEGISEISEFRSSLGISTWIYVRK